MHLIGHAKSSNKPALRAARARQFGGQSRSLREENQALQTA
jgi:cellobiose-specific phosphotransferase system component IIA